MSAGAVACSTTSWFAPCPDGVIGSAKSQSDLHPSQAIEASGNVGERQERAQKKEASGIPLPLAELGSLSGLRLLFAKQAAELVDGVRGAAFAAAGKRAGRVGDSACSAAASAGKFRFQKAGRRAADVRHKLRARRGAMNL